MFFSLSDNFEFLIKRTLKKNKVKISKISTGWTNYVFLAEISSHKKFVFRFPRNDFFAKTLYKEEKFNKFIKNKISWKVPDIKLFFDDNRPFTMHKFIEGKTLNESCNLLNEKEKRILGKDISRFIYEIQQIKKANFELPKLSQFLEGLSKVGDEKYDLSKHKPLIDLEKNSVLSHADFNPGNMILNKKNRLKAILDFAFVSYSASIVDISRVIGRLPYDYRNVFLEEYDKIFHQKTNTKDVDEIIGVWRYVEKKYIDYMSKFHKDVVLPNK